MITLDDQKMIENVDRNWNRFKMLRNKKRFEFRQGEGWLTVLEREALLDFTLSMLKKCKKMVEVYE